MTDYIRPELLRAIDTLESWAGDQIPPIIESSGICSNLARLLGLSSMECGALVSVAAQTWPEFSGDKFYPVAHPGLFPETAYTAKLDVPKWTGEYGAARRRLCQHIANWIRVNPTEASRILWGR